MSRVANHKRRAVLVLDVWSQGFRYPEELWRSGASLRAGMRIS